MPTSFSRGTSVSPAVWIPVWNRVRRAQYYRGGYPLKNHSQSGTSPRKSSASLEILVSSVFNCWVGAVRWRDLSASSSQVVARSTTSFLNENRLTPHWCSRFSTAQSSHVDEVLHTLFVHRKALRSENTQRREYSPCSE